MIIDFHKPNHAQLSKDHFLVDMHLHTKYSMDCATKPDLVYKMAKKNGIGIAVTDHNEIRGVKALSLHKDITVIPGIEVTSKEIKDILLYFDTIRGLEEFYDQVIKPHKTRLKRIRMNKVALPMSAIIEKADAYNATIAIPHPFALGKSSYPFFNESGHHHLFKRIDAIEVANGTMGRKENLASYGWAHLLGKPAIGGSDSHVYMMIGGIVTANYGHSPTTFLEQVRNGNSKVFGLEHRKSVKFVSSMAILKNKLLKNKKVRDSR